MKLKLKVFLSGLLFFTTFFMWSQSTKNVVGTVTDVNGIALPGVNVIIKGTAIGSVTDFDGKFSVKADDVSIIVFSYLGYETKEVLAAGVTEINVKLTEDTESLSEVVVTAQGITRERRSLGYATTKVEGEQVQQQPQGDIGRILQGKAAGVNIIPTSGTAGSGTNFIIRGYNSISGNNQPLFIVDGVPFGGDANEQTAFFDGTTESSRFLDLDPNSIEDIEILKGLSATVLYGEKGRNGVVLITTKGGSSKAASKKLEVSVSSTYTAVKANLPDYQTDYGGGFHQDFGFFFSNWGPNFNNTNEDNFLGNFKGVSSDGTVIVNNPVTFLSSDLQVGLEEFIGADYRYQNYNSVEDFFKTGSVSNNSINLRGTTGDTNYNINAGYYDEVGFTPGNGLRRFTFGIGGNTTLANKLKIGGTLNFFNTDYKTPPVAASTGSGTIGAGGSVFGDLLYTPRSVDLFGLPFQNANGESVYYRSGNDIQNPLWTVANSKAGQETQRVQGNLNFSYPITEDLSVSYQYGLDAYNEFNFYGQNRGGVDGEVNGIYRTIQRRTSISNHTVNFGYDKNLDENINLKVVLGGQSRNDQFEQDGVESINQLTFGILEHFNFVDHSTVNSFSGLDIADRESENQIGLYSDISLSYKRGLFLNLVGRNDWTSTLETDNFSIFYPGASVAFIPTEFFPSLITDNGLNYLKFRLGYGSSAGFPDAFSTRNTLDLASRGFVNSDGSVVSTNSVDNRLGNPDLKPERFNEVELGIDTEFWKNRISLNVSVFKKNSKDLITDQALDPSTGFDITSINLGNIETEGIEVDFSVKAVEIENFEWTLSGNFYADQNEVTELPEGTTQIALTDRILGAPANYAIVGQPFGVIQGTGVQKDENGNYLVDSTGLYLETAEEEVIGDPNPDWNAGITSSFKIFKDFTVSANLLYRHGGDIWSQTAGSLVGRGVVDPGVDRDATFILPGFTVDGNPNTTQITATSAFFNGLGFGPDVFQLYDGSTIRLNEVSVGYSVPRKFLDNTPFGSLSVSFRGNNLWYKAINFPDELNFDTNVVSTGVGNGQGIDFISGPSARRYGFSVNATF